jgi:Spy/CpxP family protein refolding chaperone
MKIDPSRHHCSRWFALLAFLILPLSLLDAAPFTARNLPALMPSPESALQHATELELTPDQRKQLGDNMADLETVATKFTTTVQRESDALAEILGADKPNESEATAQFESLLAAEAELKRVRLTMSLRTRAVLTPAQLQKLQSLQNARSTRRTSPPANRELVTKMERVRGLIERARQAGLDLSSIRTMWRRVNDLTQDGKTSEASQALDDAASDLESKLSTAPAAPPSPSATPRSRR